MLFDFVVFLLFATGIGFIIYSVVKFKPADKLQSKEQIEETLARIEETVSEADNVMNEFSALSQNIFDEITAKYKELLYLYELVDQKKSISEQTPPQVMKQYTSGFSDFSSKRNNQNNLSDISSQFSNASNRNKTEESNDDIMNFMFAFKSANPKHKEITELARRGMSISEISRALNIGHGEVSLVLEMGRSK